MDAGNFPGPLKIGSRIVHRVVPHTMQTTADPFTCRAAVLISLEGGTYWAASRTRRVVATSGRPLD